MKVLVNVTKTDIKKGECYDPWHCALAMALNRTLKKLKAQDVSVGIEDASFSIKDKYYVSKLTKKANKFVDDFDSSRNAQPCTIQLIFKELT